MSNSLQETSHIDVAYPYGSSGSIFIGNKRFTICRRNVKLLSKNEFYTATVPLFFLAFVVFLQHINTF